MDPENDESETDGHGTGFQEYVVSNHGAYAAASTYATVSYPTISGASIVANHIQGQRTTMSREDAMTLIGIRDTVQRYQKVIDELVKLAVSVTEEKDVTGAPENLGFTYDFVHDPDIQIHDLCKRLGLGFPVIL